MGAMLEHAGKKSSPGYAVSYDKSGGAGSVHPNDARYCHSHMACKKYFDSNPQDTKALGKWRVETSLGMVRASEKPPDYSPQDSASSITVVALNDADLGFREAKDGWPQTVRESETSKAWFVLKMSRTVAQGDLWQHLRATCPERLVVVVAVDALRYVDVQVSHGVSWELTATDLYRELIHNPKVNALADCAHVVVSFRTDGAFVLSRHSDHGGRDLFGTPSGHCGHLLFDPICIEGSWSEPYPGEIVGYTTCMAAAITHRLAVGATGLKGVTAGVQSGLEAMRVFHKQGYSQEGKGVTMKLRPPLDAVAKAIVASESRFSRAEVPAPPFFSGADAKNQWWTILQKRYRGSLKSVVEKIVTEGPKTALDDVPLGEFGKLVTVDRREIEGYRNVRRLMAEYVDRPTGTAPLSIAVFGPPGAGKSFGVREVALSVSRSKSREIERIEVNMAQLSGPEELYGSLHRVRDVALSGRIPLVLWDEFDCDLAGPLGWLKYFLAPMQDGVFQQGEFLHPLGRAIFAFAGSQFPTLGRFVQHIENTSDSSKARDFVSRLKGYINVLGPDPNPGDDRTPDAYYVVRRAIMLRNILERHAKGVFGVSRPMQDGHEPDQGEDDLERSSLNIDRGVLNAFLHVSRYKHGARSMEAIVTMSFLAGKKRFERSCLPTAAQLSLHVNGSEFLHLAQEVVLSDKDMKRLADEACREKLPDGASRDTLRGPGTDEEKREWILAMADDIPRDLARMGYTIVPLQSNAQSKLPALDDLARLNWAAHGSVSFENERQPVDTEGGLSHGPVRSSMQEDQWQKLTEAERQRRRDYVHWIVNVLAKAGYEISNYPGP
jgi:hypothetical protein